MATKTPIDPRDSLHGEEEKEPRFGLGHGDANSPFISKEQAKDLKNAVYDGSSKAASPGTLKSAEGAGGTGSKGAVGGAESGLANKLGKGFTGTGATMPSANPLINIAQVLARNKKKSLGGVIIGFVVSIILFLMSIGQGPLQLVHLSQILQKNFAGQEEASSIRFTALYRYAKTGDFGETRVGYFGSKNVAKTLQELKDIGIDFPDRTSLGRIKTMSIDTTKDNGFRGMTDEQIKTYLNFPDNGSATFRRQGNTVFVDVDPTTVKGIKYSKVLAGTGVASLENGRISTAMKTRVLKKFFGLPQLFSPISKRGAATAEALVDKAERRKAEEERAKPRIEANNSRFGSARASLQEKLSGKTGLFARGTLLGASALCTIREAADAAEAVNAGIRQASAVEAIDKTAVGAQGQLGINVSLPQMGAVAESFIGENDESIWDSQPLDATAKGGKGKGKDIPAAYSQAFSKNSTARKIKDEIKMEVGGVSVAGAVCSDIGLVVQGAANIGLLVAAAPTGGASLAAYMAGQAASAAATTAIAMLLTERFVDAISADESLVQVPPAGALGGGILAFGAREAANISARAAGGVELSETETLVQDQKFERQSQEEFRSKSFFARMFDVNDYRSLVSRTIDNTDTNAKSNISNIANGLANLGNMAPSLLSSMLPKASAQAEEPYNWGFSRYGIPSRLMNDPALEDPYENAKEVTKLLKENDEYADRAKRCFGVDISSGQYGLDAVATEEVVPVSDEYMDADCEHTDDSSWRRIIMFVFDTRTVTAAQCYEGDNQACSNLGVQQSSGVSSGGETTETASVEVDVANIKEPSINIDCAPGTKDVGIHDGYTEGRKVKIRVCAVSNITSTSEESNGGYGVSGANGKLVVNSRVSGAVYAMVEAAKKDGVTLSAASGFRTMQHQQDLCPCNGVDVAIPGTSNHQLGVAVDFGSGGVLIEKGSAMWNWLDKNASKFDFLPYSYEPWHWSPLENG